MSRFDKFERKYGRYAIKNLMHYIIALYALGFLIEVFFPDVYDGWLSLNAEAILHGQVWRIITFIIQPPSTSIFWIFISLYMYFMIGTVLENVWGSFKFNVYFFMGVILNVAAAIIIYLIFGVNYTFSTYYINLALFMAFVTIAPDMQMLLFFIIPIKIKWIAYFDGIYIALTIIIGYLSPLIGLLRADTAVRLINGFILLGLLPAASTIKELYMLAYINATAALLSMLNFIIFLIMTKKSRTTAGQKVFRKVMRNQKYNSMHRKKTVETNNGQNHESRGFVKVPNSARHFCAVCHRTELDAPDLEFRFCSKCEGNYEYCSEHLYTHNHVKGNVGGI